MLPRCSCTMKNATKHYRLKGVSLSACNLVINDPVGIHARPATVRSQAVTASNCNMTTIAKEGGDAPPSGRLHPCPSGLGIKQGDTVVINVEGTDADACADKLIGILAQRRVSPIIITDSCSRPPYRRAAVLFLEGPVVSRMATGIARESPTGP